MTVLVNDTVERFTVSGVGPYAYNFRIFAETELQVTACSSASPPVPTPLTYLTHYTVTGANVATGGTITLTAAAAASFSGYTLDIRSNTVEDQPTSIRNQGRFLPEIHENALDKLARQMQDLNRRVDSKFGYPDTVLTAGVLTPISSWISKYLTIGPDGLLTPAALSSTTITGPIAGALLFQNTAAETAAGITPNYIYAWSDVRRYNLVPNSLAAGGTNITALRAIASATGTSTYKGVLDFVNTTGADTYHFSGFIQLKDGIDLRLNGCRLLCTKTYAAADDLQGFLSFIRDVTIENGTIEIDYNGTGGNNAGMVLRIGSRYGYPFGTYTNGILDKDDLADHTLPPTGNIRLQNVYVKTNNPSVTAPVVMLGGLQGVTSDTLRIDGGGVAKHGIYYEYGQASTNGNANVCYWSSSHARGLKFVNTDVVNLKSDGTEGAGIGIIGAYEALVENLSVDGAFSAFEFRPGEAMFFRTWDRDSAGGKRMMTLVNITGRNLTSSAVVHVGAVSTAANGYLKDADMLAAGLPVLTDVQKTDLMRMSLNGFALSSSGAGFYASGSFDARNGTFSGTASSGQVLISDDCARFSLDNVEVLNSAGIGVRASLADSIRAVPRKKRGSIRLSKIAGNTGAGISIDNCESLLVELNQIGFNGNDAAAEATQTVGVAAASGASGVECLLNEVTTFGGAVAYSSTGSGDRGNNIQGARGTRTTSGNWRIDGMALASAAQLASGADVINTASKYLYKRVIENSNNRIYFALGPNPTDGWRLADGSATVTPV